MSRWKVLYEPRGRDLVPSIRQCRLADSEVKTWGGYAGECTVLL